MNRWIIDFSLAGIDAEGWTYAYDFAYLNKHGAGEVRSFSVYNICFLKLYTGFLFISTCFIYRALRSGIPMFVGGNGSTPRVWEKVMKLSRGINKKYISFSGEQIPSL